MIVISQLAIGALESTRYTAFMVVLFSMFVRRTSQHEDLLSAKSNWQKELHSSPLKLNIRCDFERIPGGGCQLRESYCSNHKCICKPDVPINIANRMCIARLKTVGERCTFSQECQAGSFCGAISTQNDSHTCRCKSGHAYSARRKQCVKGLKDSDCRANADCLGENVFCSLTSCDCMVGFEWYAPDEVCHKRARYGEPCENSVNCRVHDEFSACDPVSKLCTCGQFLSLKYVLDEVTHKCVSCPAHRFHNATNSCQPDRRTVDYTLLDRSTMERNSHQYVYVALSMTPFIVFALIGFIYRYVNPSASFPEQVFEAPPVLTLSGNTEILDYCPLQIDLNGNPVAQSAPSGDSHSADLCILGAQLLPAPPPSYDIASKDLPPSYDEVVGSQF